MNATWPNLTGKIEPAHRQALRTIATAAGSAGVEWFLTGATARDWVFKFMHGVDTVRATHDADIGVAVARWDEFNQIREEIIASGEFVADRVLHRVNHKTMLGFHIDLVPFGQVSGEQYRIAWPPDQDEVMNVMGFEDAFRAALTVLADTDLPVRVASPAGMMLLKIFAWEDRKRLQPGKDAIDIRLILTNYEKVSGRDLWDIEGLMDAENFAPDNAAARLLGMDVAHILLPGTRETLMRILDRETNTAGNQFLIEQMTTTGREFSPETVTKLTSLLQSFRNGLAGIPS